MNTVAEETPEGFMPIRENGICGRRSPTLSQEGKMVHELRPAVDWNKGHAVQWPTPAACLHLSSQHGGIMLSSTCV